MNEQLRFLLYPLGYLSYIAFGGRFLWQWLVSEKAGASVVPKAFWFLCLFGNGVMAAHGMIQLQYHVSVLQAINGVIAWRNLNLMEVQEKHRSLFFTVAMMVVAVVAVTACFLVQHYFISHASVEWFRSPIKSGTLPWQWHLYGIMGMALFSSRFWVQWWCVEQRQQSFLAPSFWWLTIAGNAMTVSYFYLLGDPVNFIGPLFSLIPSVRNLMLLRRTGTR